MNKDLSGTHSARDLIAGLVLVLLGVLMIALSLTLDRPRGWLSAPGLTPLFVFLVIAVLGANLSWRAFRTFRSGAPASPPQEKVARDPVSPSKIVFLFTALLLYYLVFVRVFPFELSTFIFLFSCLRVFYSRNLLANLAIALSASLAIAFAFTEFFGVYLPGVEWTDFISAVLPREFS